MLNPIQLLIKPEYLFRPPQVWRRFHRCWHRRQDIESVRLPWGAVVKVRTAENIGADIYYFGIFDKIVPEAIARLVEPGEWAIEVGANIGQNCSLMALKVGPGGHVYAFEPHPELYGELRANAALWTGLKLGQLHLENVALGREEQEAWLVNGDDFSHNRGSASLQAEARQQDRSFKVRVRTLDEYVERMPKVGVCKIDVEGHELAVLEGGKRALKRKAIRDVIFEDFAPQPGPVAGLLREHGYTVFRLVAHWLKPSLEPLETTDVKHGRFSHNYLATLEPERARARFRRPGWFSLLNL